MDVRRHARYRLSVGAWAALAILMITTTPPQMAGGQSFVEIDTCKKLESGAVVGGSAVTTRECGTQFTTADAYVGAVITLHSICESVTAVVDLFDPQQISVYNWPASVRVDPGQCYSRFALWFVLPLAAHDGMLNAENPLLLRARIRVENPLARNRLGDWTIRVRLGNSAPISRKFTLVAAP